MAARSAVKQIQIDWTNVRKRLARTAAWMDSSPSLTQEQSDELLVRRAQQLARVPDAPLAPSEVIEVLTFMLANEAYAVEARVVKEIARLTDFTPVPGTPEFLVGVSNL